MNRSALFVLCLLFSSVACFGQNTPPDSQTLQALLVCALMSNVKLSVHWGQWFALRAAVKHGNARPHKVKLSPQIYT